MAEFFDFLRWLSGDNGLVAVLLGMLFACLIWEIGKPWFERLLDPVKRHKDPEGWEGRK